MVTDRTLAYDTDGRYCLCSVLGATCMVLSALASCLMGPRSAREGGLAWGCWVTCWQLGRAAASPAQHSNHPPAHRPTYPCRRCSDVNASWYRRHAVSATGPAAGVAFVLRTDTVGGQPPKSCSAADPPVLVSSQGAAAVCYGAIMGVLLREAGGLPGK